MQIQSIFVGKPIDHEWKGRTVHTGIFKTLVHGPVKLSKTLLEGDGQGDLVHHGGEDKAVYSYAIENYKAWEKLRGVAPQLGAFGENLLTRGLDEASLNVGDRLQLGSQVILKVAEPRMPCSRLGLRFEDDSIIRQFNELGLCGAYFSVEQTGSVQAGDEIKFIQKASEEHKLYDLFRLRLSKQVTVGELDHWLSYEHFTDVWREWAENKKERLLKRS